MATDTKQETIKDTEGNEFNLRRTLSPEGVVHEDYVRKDADPEADAEKARAVATERDEKAAAAAAELDAASRAETRAKLEADRARLAAQQSGYRAATKTPHEFAQAVAAEEQADELRQADKAKGKDAKAQKGTAKRATTESEDAAKGPNRKTRRMASAKRK